MFGFGFQAFGFHPFGVDPYELWFGTASFTGTGSLTIAARRRTPAVAFFDGDGVLFSPRVYRRTPGNIDWDGLGDFDTRLIAQYAIRASLAGAGDFDVRAVRITRAAADLDGLGSLVFRATLIDVLGAGSVDLDGAGNLLVPSADITLQMAARANFQGQGDFDTRLQALAVGRNLFDGDSSLIYRATLIDVLPPGSVDLDGSGALYVDRPFLQAATRISFAGAGALAVRGARLTPAVSSFQGTGALATRSELRVTGRAVFNGAGFLSGALPLSVPAITAELEGTGSLVTRTGQIRVIAANWGNFTGIAALTARAALREPGRSVFVGAGAFITRVDIDVIGGRFSFIGAGDLEAALLLQPGMIRVGLDGEGDVYWSDVARLQAFPRFFGTGDLEVSPITGGLAGRSQWLGVGDLDTVPARRTLAVADLDGIGALVARTGAITVLNTAAFYGASQMTTRGLLQAAGLVDLHGTGDIDFPIAQIALRTVDFDGVGTLFVRLAQVLRGVMAGSGTLTTRAAPFLAGRAVLAGAGDLELPLPLDLIAGRAALDGAGALTVPLAAQRPAGFDLDGLGLLQAAIRGQLAGSGLVGDGDLETGLLVARRAVSLLAGVGKLDTAILARKELANVFAGTGDLEIPAGTVMPTLAAWLRGAGGIAPGGPAPVIVLFGAYADLDGTGALFVAPKDIAAAPTVFDGQGLLVSRPSPLRVAATSFDGEGFLAARSPPLQVSAVVEFDGEGVIADRIVQAQQIRASLGGAGELDVVTAPAIFRVVLAGQGQLAVAPVARYLLSTSLSGSGFITGRGGIQLFSSPTLFAGSGALGVALRRATPAVTSLAGTGALNLGLLERARVVVGFAGSSLIYWSDVALFPISTDLDGIGSLSAATRFVLPLSTILAGAGGLDTSLKTGFLAGTTALSGAGKLSTFGEATEVFPIFASLAGSGDLQARTAPAVFRAVLAGQGSLGAALRQRAAGLAVLAGLGNLALPLARLQTMQPNLMAGVASLAYAAQVASPAAAEFIGAGGIVGQGGAARVAAGAWLVGDSDLAIAPTQIQMGGVEFNGRTLLYWSDVGLFPLTVRWTGAGNLTVRGGLREPVRTGLVGSGVITVRVKEAVALHAAFDGTGLLTMADDLPFVVAGIARLVGSGTLIAASGRALPGVAAIAGEGVLDLPLEQFVEPFTAEFSGQGEFSAVGARAADIVVALDGAGLFVAAELPTTLASSLAGEGLLLVADLEVRVPLQTAFVFAGVGYLAPPETKLIYSIGQPPRMLGAPRSQGGRRMTAQRSSRGGRLLSVPRTTTPRTGTG